MKKFTGVIIAVIALSFFGNCYEFDFFGIVSYRSWSSVTSTSWTGTAQVFIICASLVFVCAIIAFVIVYTHRHTETHQAAFPVRNSQKAIPDDQWMLDADWGQYHRDMTEIR